MKINIDKKALAKNGLPVLGGLLTLLGMVVSNKVDANNRNDMKAELKTEILDDLLKKND